MNDASSSIDSSRKQEKDIPQWLQIKSKAPSPPRKTRLKGVVPSPPAGEPIVIGRGKNKIALSWELPEDKGDSDIVAYKIEMCRPSVGQWEQVGVTIDTNFEVYNLKTNVEYLFRVSAMNKAGWSAPSCMSRSVRTVSDAEPPEFRQKLPKHVEFTCGQVLKLEVRVTGIPEPDVKWYKNGIEILNNHVHHIIPGYREHHALIITLTGENDQGRYTCKAFNSSGEATTGTLLAFIVPDVDDYEARQRRQRLLAATYAITDEEEAEEPQELVDMAPEVILKLRNRTVKERSDIKLTTRILAVPESNVTWYKDGKPVKETDNLKIFIENGLHCLEIIETKENDSGVYSVVAVNPLGSTTCKAELVVEGAAFRVNSSIDDIIHSETSEPPITFYNKYS